MEPSNPPSVPPTPQMRPLPQPKVPLPSASAATNPQADPGATIDEANTACHIRREAAEWITAG